jgi:hypothetical protein
VSCKKTRHQTRRRGRKRSKKNFSIKTEEQRTKKNPQKKIRPDEPPSKTGAAKEIKELPDN